MRDIGSEASRQFVKLVPVESAADWEHRYTNSVREDVSTDSRWSVSALGQGSRLGLTSPDFDLAPKRDKKSGNCYSQTS